MMALQQQNCRVVLSLHRVGTTVCALVPPAAFFVLHLWISHPTVQSETLCLLNGILEMNPEELRKGHSRGTEGAMWEVSLH